MVSARSAAAVARATLMVNGWNAPSAPPHSPLGGARAKLHSGTRLPFESIQVRWGANVAARVIVLPLTVPVARSAVTALGTPPLKRLPRMVRLTSVPEIVPVRVVARRWPFDCSIETISVQVPPTAVAHAVPLSEPEVCVKSSATLYPLQAPGGCGKRPAEGGRPSQ